MRCAWAFQRASCFPDGREQVTNFFMAGDMVAWTARLGRALLRRIALKTPKFSRSRGNAGRHRQLMHAMGSALHEAFCAKSCASTA